MRYLFSLITFMLCLHAAASADAGIRGILKEKNTGLTVEYATVALHDAGTGRMTAGCMTDADGRFAFSGVNEGTYYVECSFVGFKTVRSKSFEVGHGQTVDIGTVYLEDDGKMLDEVVVEGRKPTFTAALDRKVYNVGEDLTSTTGSVSDLMQNIPSVDVDIDGNVSLRGNENVTILINGKPSAMMNARTRGDALNQLAAGTIERIEVITNPSAEFKPDGVSGIINIVMKKGAKAGLNGTVMAGAGSAGRNNAGADMNYGTGKVNIFGGYSYRRDRYDRSTGGTRSSATDIIKQTTRGRGLPMSHLARLGMSADVTKNDAFDISGSYNRRRFRRDEQMESVTNYPEGGLADFYRRIRDALAYENMYEAAARYTHRYGEEREWGINYTYSSESEDENNDYATSRQSGDSRNREHVWDAEYIHVLTLHWSHRLGDKTKLSAGYELEHLRAEQNFHVSDLVGTEYVDNADLSSDFTHMRLINSLYATAEAQLGTWKLLGGLRGEYVSQENRFISDGTSASQHYASVYPTLHATYAVDRHNELMLSYSLRVNRPEGSDMNPFPERINPLSMQAGNPDLKPEKIHSIEAGWQWRKDEMTLLGTLYYRYLTNRITEVSRYIENGVLLTTKENMNSSQSAGAEVIFDGSEARWLSFNCNINGFFNQIDASDLGYGRQRNAFSWSARINANFTPLRHWLIQLNARFHSSSLVPQGRRDADSRVNLGMKYDLPKYNLALTASVTDVFDTYRRSYTLDTPELKQHVVSRRNPRIFSFGLTWRFGGKAPGKKTNDELQYDEGF